MGKSKKGRTAEPDKSQPPPSEQELQRRHERWLTIISTVRTLFVTAMWAGACYGIAYSIFYLPVQASHGEVTTITQTQNFLADIKANVALAWGVGGGGAAYGWITRRKLLRERKEKDARITELERRLDPNRTSSGLAPDGADALKGEPGKVQP